jgi:hypothetical protein
MGPNYGSEITPSTLRVLQPRESQRDSTSRLRVSGRQSFP